MLHILLLVLKIIGIIIAVILGILVLLILIILLFRPVPGRGCGRRYLEGDLCKDKGPLVLSSHRFLSGI